MKEQLERIAEIQAAAVVDVLAAYDPTFREIGFYTAIRMSQMIEKKLMGPLVSEIGKDFQLKEKP